MHRACYRYCQGSMSRKLWLGLAVFGAMLAYGQSGAPSRAGIKIMVPALVESKAGEVAYGLSGDNFLIKDDGIEQRVDLESDPGAQPLSLLLVIQTGHNAAAQLGNIARLDDLLDSILTSPRDQVGIITFDGRPRLVQDFTTDSEAVSNSLSTIEPGNANAAFFDAIHMAVAALRKTPSNTRHVILLISGEHDHGSNASDTASLIRDVSASDSSIYSLSFRPDRKELIGQVAVSEPAGDDSQFPAKECCRRARTADRRRLLPVRQ